MQNGRQTFITFFFCLLAVSTIAQNLTLYVGTYTRKTSEGIYIYQFNTKTGDFTPLSIAKGIDNPSFLALSPNRRFLYSGGSKKGDSVHAFAIDKQTHYLTLLNTQSLEGGLGATHLELDRTGKWLFVSNYGSGNICVLPILPNGQLDKVHQSLQMEGKSVRKDRQDRPHLHSLYVMPNNKDVFAPDLGTDKIMVFTLDATLGKLTEGVPAFVKTDTGAGPRHMAFHPNNKFAYVIQELNSTITAFSYEKGSLKPIQTVKTLPDDYKGLKWSADIHISPDGKFLYGSNRAHESLAIYRINKKTGQLTFIGHQSVNGKTPRNFVIDPTGQFILVANQDSDNITIFKRNKKTGLLTPTGKEINVSMPVCLKFY
ncbi:MAG: lactonase family protein [Saprospiraceae bacterium]|nr:lactonase family protein [Saprospiraceae bacterium]